MTGEERLTLSEVHHVAAGEYAEIAQIVGRLLADARLTDPGSLRIEVRWTEMWVEEDDDCHGDSGSGPPMLHRY